LLLAAPGDAAREDDVVENIRVPTPTEAVSTQAVTLTTSDGERLAAQHLAGPLAPADPGAVAVVVAHGFTGSIAKPTMQAVSSALARHAGVVAFDFRGHGR